mmetsp:Transcript_16945/g.46375  ORF Transcript_16945/g.46375 Transcript_16945/m.46375 type:complete len:218 (-) Transcript_16945:412-1065(-)
MDTCGGDTASRRADRCQTCTTVSHQSLFHSRLDLRRNYSRPCRPCARSRCYLRLSISGQIIRRGYHAHDPGGPCLHRQCPRNRLRSAARSNPCTLLGPVATYPHASGRSSSAQPAPRVARSLDLRRQEERPFAGQGPGRDRHPVLAVAVQGGVRSAGPFGRPPESGTRRGRLPLPQRPAPRGLHAPPRRASLRPGLPPTSGRSPPVLVAPVLPTGPT